MATNLRAALSEHDFENICKEYDEMYPISVTNPTNTTEGETSVPYKESDTTRYTMPIQFFDFKPRSN